MTLHIINEGGRHLGFYGSGITKRRQAEYYKSLIRKYELAWINA